MIPKLAIHHLTLLSALADTGSMTASASRLGITQSAASHRLREAERRIGLPLVKRAETGLHLTSGGERLKRLGESFLAELFRLEQELEASARDAVRLVRLGQSTYSRYHWFPAFLDFLEARCPDLAVDLSGRATAHPLTSLLDGSVDVSLIFGREPNPGRFRSVKLSADPVVAVMSRHHPLASEPVVNSLNMGDARFFIYPLTAEPGLDWTTLLGDPVQPFRRLSSMPTPEAVIDLVRANYGVALFSKWAIEPELADGTLVARPISEEGLYLDWWCVTRTSDPQSSPAARLAAALLDWSAQSDRSLSTLAFDTR
ncbi:LysR family transcriptional regulator [Roseibium aggregatum]|uniref:LysR family transcriptional regulator n=1 Tax=Roseibium aggregatum TaxID=187304 RepID=A0A939EDF0_9HYPH|nr:LysR family transcriptional regulator [Roseibium aggregatum]MBN9669564.1 LysR family transcriptional regulator [Roseibium aggregatum]